MAKSMKPWIEEDNRILREYVAGYSKSIAFKKSSVTLKRTIGACSAHYYDITKTKLINPKPIVTTNSSITIKYNGYEILVEDNKLTFKKGNQVLSLET